MIRCGEAAWRAADADLLRALVERHAELTGSARAKAILSRWDHHLPHFWKVAPHLALTEEGPQTVVHRHLESIRIAAAAAQLPSRAVAERPADVSFGLT